MLCAQIQNLSVFLLVWVWNPRKKLFDTPKKKKKKQQQHQSEKKLELKPKAWGTIGKNLVTPNEEEVQHW